MTSVTPRPRPMVLLLALAFGGASVLAPSGPGVFAQAAPPAAVAIQNAGDLLTQPQIEQILAPIALFPDELLMQVLMAATYPLEIVQAKRWLGQSQNGGQNAALTGDALVAALAAQPWDPSVKSLTPFPDVLGMMNDQLEWTQQLGDAVLEQQDDVMNAIQVLRGRAQAAGMLVSGPQQTVTVTQNVNLAPVAGAVVAPPAQIIVIAPTQAERVYVPVYNPTVVFGTWPHPGFPPTYFPPPAGYNVGNALLTGLAFATGVAVVGSLWGWARPGWGGSSWGGSGGNSINVNANRYNNINVNRTQINANNWRHDSSHRQGVAYRNQNVSSQFRADGQRAAPNRDAQRDQFRGRAEAAGIGGGDRAGARPGVGGGDRPGLGGGDRQGLGGADRPGGGDRPGLGAGNRPGGGDRPSLGGGDRPGAGGAGLGGANRPSLPDRPAAGNRPQAGNIAASGRPQVQRPAQTPARQAPAALQGAGQGQGRDVRAAAQRGQASRQSQAAPRPQARPQASPQARQAAQQRVQARPQGGGGGGPRAGGGGGQGRGGR